MCLTRTAHALIESRIKSSHTYGTKLRDESNRISVLQLGMVGVRSA